jgi:hypothetical protein
MTKQVKIYVLWKLDSFSRPKFVGRYASKHRMSAAMLEDVHYFYDVEYKDDEYGGTINISEELKK